MSHNSLIAEYNRRTGGSITPPKKMINSSASATKFKLGDSVTECPTVHRGQLAADRSHIGSSKINFGEVVPTSETQPKPAKPQPPARSVEDHIEFGKSEPEIIRVKKIQAPEAIIHIAGTKVAFGDRNIPETGKSKPAKKHAPEIDAAKDHVTMGETAIAPPPPSATKCSLLTTFEETEKNMAPTTTPMKPAKFMAPTPSKESMVETLKFVEENTIVQQDTSRRVPVGGNTSVVFNDEHSRNINEAKTHSEVFTKLSVKSPRPVNIKHNSRNMQSSCFDHTMAVPVEKRAKKEVEPDHPSENTCPNNADILHDSKQGDQSPVKSAKKNTVHSSKASLNSIFSDNKSYQPEPRSVKKSGFQPSSIFSFESMSDTSAPPTKLIPTSVAAGAKPKSLEPAVRTRGPVGGQVSVIFG